MKRVRSLVIAPLLALAVWAATVLVSAGAPPASAPTSGPADPRLCADLMTGLKAWMADPQSDHYLTATQKHGIRNDPLTGCRWRIESGVKQVPFNSVPKAATTGALLNAFAYSGGCFEKYIDYGIWDPNNWAPIMVGYTDTGWCNNGYSYTGLWWGPNCWTSTYPIYGTSIPWCGWGRWATPWSSNGTCSPQSGMNWNWWYWTSPWWVRSGSYMRTQVFCNGQGSVTWGYAYDI